MGGLSGVVRIQNDRSVLSLLKVANLKDRWENGGARDEILEELRSCIRRGCQWTFG